MFSDCISIQFLRLTFGLCRRPNTCIYPTNAVRDTASTELTTLSNFYLPYSMMSTFSGT